MRHLQRKNDIIRHEKLGIFCLALAITNRKVFLTRGRNWHNSNYLWQTDLRAGMDWFISAVKQR